MNSYLVEVHINGGFSEGPLYTYIGEQLLMIVREKPLICVIMILLSNIERLGMVRCLR